MNSIAAYMNEHNLNDEAMAELISSKLGRGISAKGVQQIKTRKEAPAPWLRALEIAPAEPKGLGKEKRATIPGRGEPSNPEPILDLPFELTSAKVTLEMIYSMVGKGAAMGTRTPAVSQLWEQSAPSLADAWIDWAKENRTVANGIAMLTIGGPGGQVVLLNASLMITTLMAVQRQRGVELIPSQFMPPHEQPEGNEENIRHNTEKQVDDALRQSQG